VPSAIAQHHIPGLSQGGGDVLHDHGGATEQRCVEFAGVGLVRADGDHHSVFAQESGVEHRRPCRGGADDDVG
jgi:hypothetical protein